MTLPTHLASFFAHAEASLEHGIVCIGENHTVPDGRLLVDALLKTKKVRNFFIEYHPSANAGDAGYGLLNNAFQSYGKNFQLSRVPVVPPAVKSEKTVEQRIVKADHQAGVINNLFTTMPLCTTDAKPDLKELAFVALQNGTKVYAADPAIKKGLHYIPERNKETAAMVAKTVYGKSSHALLLWGAGHFASEDGIHTLLMEFGFRVEFIDVSRIYRTR